MSLQLLSSKLNNSISIQYKPYLCNFSNFFGHFIFLLLCSCLPLCYFGFIILDDFKVSFFVHTL